MAKNKKYIKDLSDNIIYEFNNSFSLKGMKVKKISKVITQKQELLTEKVNAGLTLEKMMLLIQSDEDKLKDNPVEYEKVKNVSKKAYNRINEQLIILEKEKEILRNEIESLMNKIINLN